MQFEKIYIDMDGVLANFEGAFFDAHGITCEAFDKQFGQVEFWETVYEDPTFFSSMPPMPDMGRLLDECMGLSNKLVILSSPSRTNRPLCMMHKRQWIDKHIGEMMPAIFESDKHIYSRPGRLLIDDYEKKCQKWEENGGTAHHYTDFDNFMKFITTL